MSSFFFSSRRRHTRWPRDWSSDVCSSDLHASVDARIGGSIPHAHFVPVPPPARIGDIKHAAEIQIKIGLGNNPVLPVVVMLPEIPVVEPAQRAAMHTGGSHLRNIPKALQPLLKLCQCQIRLASRRIHRFIMIADFVTHLRNLPDHTLIKRLRHQPEIVRTANSPLVLNTGKPKRMLLARIHIMAKKDNPFRRIADKLMNRLKRKSSLLQTVKKFFIG